MKLNTTAIKFEEEIQDFNRNAILIKKDNNLKYERLKSRLSIVYFVALLASLIFLFAK